MPAGGWKKGPARLSMSSFLLPVSLTDNPSCLYRYQNGHVGSDDDEGRQAKAKNQDEEDVDPVTQRRLHSPPWKSGTGQLEQPPTFGPIHTTDALLSVYQLTVQLVPYGSGP